MQYFDIYIDSMKGIYTYSDKNDEFEIGENVIVPFRNIKKSGFIIRKNLKEHFEFKVLNISSKVKNSLKLSNEQIKLIEWMVDYYLASYDSVIKAMIPKKIKISYNNIYIINLDRLNILSEYLDNEIINYVFSLVTISYNTVKSKFKKSVIDSLINKNFLYKNENNIYVNIEKFYKLKEETEENVKSSLDAISYEDVMPDLEGMSPQEVLAIFKETDIDIEVTGTGLVKEQKPAAGDSLKNIKKVKIILE